MDITFGIGQAIGGLGQMLGQGMQARQSRENLRAQQKHEKYLAEYRYSKDLEMWEKANLYNEPSQQMARLRAGGLNPAMMYGKATGANVAASQLPKYNQAAPDFSKVQSPMAALGVLGMFQDIALKQEQVDNVRKKNEAQDLQNGITRLNKRIKTAETDYKLSEQWQTDYDGKGSFRKGNYLQFLLESQLDALESQNRLRDQSRKKSLQDTYGSYQTNQLRKFELEAWKSLGKSGKIGQFALPFMRMLLGR